MKTIVAFICFAGFLALATATPLCEKADDCGEDECCVAISMGTATRRGFCLKLRRERQRCSPPDSQLSDYYGGKYMRFCPCQQSLECSEIGNTKLYRCEKGSGTTAEPDGTNPTATNPVTDGDNEGTPGATTPEATPEPTTEEELEGAPPQGPGGEKPRDDDCEDWEYPC